VNAFIQKHRSVVTGSLVGFDRLVLRGALRPISYLEGMNKCLGVEGVLLKDFGPWVQSKTKALVSETERFVEQRGRGIVFLDSPNVVKEEVALSIAQREGVKQGLICVLKTVEPCKAFDVRKNREKKLLELVMRNRKCSTFYHYVIHPEWGFSYARIQTWLPFNVQLYLNGREWLARGLDRAGVRYTRADNTFTWIEDVEVAQALLNQQLAMDWNAALEPISRLMNPLFPKGVFNRFELPSYNWTVHQSEVATDVMFADDAALRRVYRGLVLQGINSFGCGDAMRFLGHRRTNADGSIRTNFNGDVSSDLKQRPEGLRLKHTTNGNSVKVYDKAGCVLRVETTVNNPRDFKVDRPDSTGKALARQRLRKSIEDLPRLSEISQQSNERYLEALGSLQGSTPLGALAATIGKPSTLKDRRVRALNPHAPHDAELFRAVSRGEFAINGFRNRDLCALLHKEPDDPVTRRRQSANVTRRIRILRGHGLVYRQPKSHRYNLTERGRSIVSALLAALDSDVTRLTQAA
jgi:hypothetical protein